ncbi:MAG TPA: hypothetical protein VHM31_23265 [Polyangia bacterium]|nr:hypothetical protein [Polyangia bacterium]
MRLLLGSRAMRTSSFVLLAIFLGLTGGCGSGSNLGGTGVSSGQGTGGTGTGGQATGGRGAAGGGTGGAAEGGAGGQGGGGRGGAGGANGGPCWSKNDCGPSATCVPPGASVCGGACIPVQHPCHADTECAGDAATPSVCEAIPCSCPSAMGCVPGCSTDADCAEGQSCHGTHHCGPMACGSGAATCPTDFICATSAVTGGTCVRKPCSSDADCSAACVSAECYRAPGTCRLPVP